MPAPGQESRSLPVTGIRLTDESAVLTALAAHWTRLREENGDFGLDEADFRRRVLDTIGRRVEAGEGTSGLPILQRLALDDLYLAQGCAARSDRAWRLFERRHGRQLDQLALLYATTTVAAEDARQELVGALFGARQGPGGLHSYRGNSSLVGWLRVAMRRMVIDLHRSRAFRPVAGPDATAELQGVVDPEPRADTRLAERRLAHELVELVEDAVRRLPEDDRTMLLRYHRDGAILKVIGLELGIHQATVLRHLERIRDQVGRAVIKAARERLGLQPEEVRAVTELMSDLFRFHLCTPDDPAA